MHCDVPTIVTHASRNSIVVAIGLTTICWVAVAMPPRLSVTVNSTSNVPPVA